MYTQIIHIDGPDKTGKDTLRDLVVKNAKGNYLVYVRSFISQIVYSRLYSRKINEKFFLEKLRDEYLEGAKFFVLTCSADKAESRFIKHAESDILISEFVKHQKAFTDFVEEAAAIGIKIHVIDTSLATPRESAIELENNIQRSVTSNCVNCILCKAADSQKSQNYSTGGTEILVINSVNLHTNIEAFNFLNECLLEAGVLEKCTVTDLVKCSTKFGNIVDADIKSCAFHLKHQLQMFQPKLVVALGNQVYDYLISSRIVAAHKIVKINSPAVINFGNVTKQQYLKQIKKAIRI